MKEKENKKLLINLLTTAKDNDIIKLQIEKGMTE